MRRPPLKRSGHPKPSDLRPNLLQRHNESDPIQRHDNKQAHPKPNSNPNNLPADVPIHVRAKRWTSERFPAEPDLHFIKRRDNF